MNVKDKPCRRCQTIFSPAGTKQSYCSVDCSFLHRVVRRLSGCWVWGGSTDHDGYGQFSHDLNDFKAHRVAWEIEYDVLIPAGLCVLHACDNPPCCNPAHLFLGTQGDNTADKVAKGRQLRGSSIGTTKLTENDVRDIRASDTNQYELARLYRVQQSQISRIKRRKRWTHLV